MLSFWRSGASALWYQAEAMSVGRKKMVRSSAPQLPNPTVETSTIPLRYTLWRCCRVEDSIAERVVP